MLSYLRESIMNLLILLISLNLSFSNQEIASADNINSAPLESKSSGLSVSGEVILLSNDISRGISMSNNESVLQGWLGFSYLGALNAGIFSSETYFPVPSDPTGTSIARRYNVYYASAYATLTDGLFLGLQYFHYDFTEYTELNYKEYFLEVFYKNLKLTYIFNPNYAGLETKYEYISIEHKFELSKTDSLTPLLSTSIIEKPENVDIKDYQELKLTYSKDLERFKVNVIASTTNRKHYYTDDKYKDSGLAFGIVVPFSLEAK